MHWSRSLKKQLLHWLPTNHQCTRNQNVYCVWSVEPVFEDQGQPEAEFYIIVVFDQAIYAKAIVIKWKSDERFRHIVIRKGAFHIICLLLGIIGKRFQGAGFRILCIESQVIAESSVSELWKDWDTTVPCTCTSLFMRPWWVRQGLDSAPG